MEDAASLTSEEWEELKDKLKDAPKMKDFRETVEFLELESNNETLQLFQWLDNTIRPMLRIKVGKATIDLDVEEVGILNYMLQDWEKYARDQ